MEKTNSNQNDILSDSWDETKFSQSVNNVLNEARQQPSGVDIFFFIELLFIYHPEYGSVDPKHLQSKNITRGLKFQELINYLKLNKNHLRAHKRTAGEYAKLVLEVTNVPLVLRMITGRLFLLALILLINMNDFSEGGESKQVI